MVFYMYRSTDSVRIGTVFAKDWVEARTLAAQKWGYEFGEVFACTVPLPEEGGLVIW